MQGNISKSNEELFIYNHIENVAHLSDRVATIKKIPTVLEENSKKRKEGVPGSVGLHYHNPWRSSCSKKRFLVTGIRQPMKVCTSEAQSFLKISQFYQQVAFFFPSLQRSLSTNCTLNIYCCIAASCIGSERQRGAFVDAILIPFTPTVCVNPLLVFLEHL